MLTRDMKKIELNLGILKHHAGGAFSITARFYETPPDYDYWIAVYDGNHDQWGHMRFQATIPKRIASTTELAIALISGTITDQVKSTLSAANATGRSLEAVFSRDGWTLV